MAQRSSLSVVFVVCLLLAGASTPAVAGDESISLEFDPETTDVEPGERVELSVVATTNGGNDSEGVQNSTVRLIYPGEYLDVVAVEPGGFMQHNSGSLSVDRRVNNSVGVLEFDQHRSDGSDGARGTAFLAHVTVEVAADAPQSTLLVSFEGSRFERAVTGFPLPTFTESAEIAVEGGGERIEPTTPETVAFETDALSENSTVDDTEGADESGPGLDVLAGVLGVGVIMILVGVRARVRD